MSDLRLDTVIGKYCGADWPHQLEEITGSPFTIIDDQYKAVITKVSACEINIGKLLRKLIRLTSNAKIIAMEKEFDELSKNLDITKKAYVKKQRGRSPPKEVLDSNYLPGAIIKSPWFTFIKNIEKDIFHLLQKIFITSEDVKTSAKTTKARRNIFETFTWDHLVEIYRDHPNFRDIYEYNGIKFTSQEIFETVLKLHHFSSVIINFFLEPICDVRKIIENNYERKLKHLFKPEMMRKNHLSKDLIVNLLTEFMIARYRSGISGNPKYYVQMLMNNISEGDLSSISGPRFIEIMDTINLDEMDPKAKATRFTVKAKDLMKKMVDAGDGVDVKLIEEVKEIMEDIPPELPPTEPPSDIVEGMKAADDIFKE